MPRGCCADRHQSTPRPWLQAPTAAPCLLSKCSLYVEVILARLQQPAVLGIPIQGQLGQLVVVRSPPSQKTLELVASPPQLHPSSSPYGLELASQDPCQPSERDPPLTRLGITCPESAGRSQSQVASPRRARDDSHGQHIGRCHDGMSARSVKYESWYVSWPACMLLNQLHHDVPHSSRPDAFPV